MTSAIEVFDVGIVSRRPDGSAISAGDLVAYLEAVRVAAGVIDGARVGEPALHTLRIALDADGGVVYADDLVRDGLDWQGLIRSVVHRFETLALVDDGIVDAQGRHHELDDLPEELERHLDALPVAEPAVGVHVMRTDSDADIDAELIASSIATPVERARVDGFTLVRDSSSPSPNAVADEVLRSQLPAVSFRRDGEAAQALVRVRRGRRVVMCHVMAPAAPALPETLHDTELRELLAAVEVRHHSRHRFDAATLALLARAGTGGTSFARDVADVVGVPVAAAAWLDDDAPPGPVDLVEPATARQLVARAAREEFSRESLTKGPLGGLRRFLLDHPWVTLVYGSAELAVAAMFLTVAADWGIWGPVRWIGALAFGIDGIVSLAVAGTVLRRRRR